MYQINTLYTFNLHIVIYQLYLIKIKNQFDNDKLHNKKWAKGLNRFFTKKNSQKVNK